MTATSHLFIIIGPRPAARERTHTQHLHAQELFIKGLAESKTFQRFAVHTDRHIRQYKKDGLEQFCRSACLPLHQYLDELHKQATTTMRASSSSSSSFSTSNSTTNVGNNAASFSRGAGAGGGGGDELLKPPQRPLHGVLGFFSAFARVIRRDLGMVDNIKKQ
jgi:hypothetical protein